MARWTGSLLIGIVIVYVLLVLGLYFSGYLDDTPTPGNSARAIDLLAEIDRVRLQDELGLTRPRTRAVPPPPPVTFSRQVSGFVQLEVEVGASGDVVNARVVGAVPKGYYEEQALQEVRLRSYEPAPAGSYRQTEVVPFTVTVESGDALPEG